MHGPFGQENDIKHFEDQYRNGQRAEAGKNILFGSFRGAATLVNSLREKFPVDQDAMAKCLVLFGVFRNAESVVLHGLYSSLFGWLPFSRLWVPLVAKWLTKKQVPGYNPGGATMISSVELLSPKLPVVIIQPKPFGHEARAVYCALKEARQKNDNVYLMELEEPKEPKKQSKILNPHQKQALQAIYAKHGLPYQGEVDGVDLTRYTPSPIEVESKIRSTKRRIFWKHTIIDICATAAVLGAIYFKYFRSK